MKTIFSTLFSIACLSAAALNPAGAQSMYKCTVDGKVSYGDQPCQGGPSQEMKVPAAPVQSAEERATLARQKQTADSMESERLGREAKEERERQRAGRAIAAQRTKCNTLKLDAKWMQEAAQNPGVRRSARAEAATAARHAAEALAVQCPP